ncbi:unnamed protein product [Bursaphelenchus okinawaensis]|uniref:Glyco_transf_64 domain-containing protein n=1 Tax=Bursaphelenchus okinawaensis TaxID=465554 RepID=A0A811K8T7_9BILA|nr:unnamed protein product [Bursaphelenchus okinawaensis]CAG9096130.1 unnamed protein product [Bursaphelenchus okinawaensis]
MIDYCLKPNKWGVFKERLKEQNRIFDSIRAEHLELIQKLEESTAQLEELQRKIPLKKEEIDRLESKIEELKLVQRDLKDRRSVKLQLPLSPVELTPSNRSFSNTDEIRSSSLTLEDVFDYSKCSISSRFSVYVYELSNLNDHGKALQSRFMESPYRTSNSSTACLYIYITNEVVEVENLDYFGKSGKNHIIITYGDVKHVQDSRPAVLVAQHLGKGQVGELDQELFLKTDDLVDFNDIEGLLPEKITYFLSYQIGEDSLSSDLQNQLKNLAASGKASMDDILIDLICTSTENGLCGDASSRRSIQKQSTFTLLFYDQPSFSTRLFECLNFGSVPVIIKSGRRKYRLPFDDYIDWRLVLFTVSEARLPELHFILRSFELEDILEMKRKGRFYLENYLVNSKVLASTILTYIRHKLLIPGREATTMSLEKFEPTNTYSAPSVRPVYDDEFLGPVEPEYNSVAYNHNFTAITMYSSALWNYYPSQIHSAPEFITVTPPLPSEIEFNEHLNTGMRPIAPGSGLTYSQSLGGNRKREQFTAVIQTYNRDSVLNVTLADLNRLPYLNKVIVVWNNIDRSPESLIWPKLHCPIVFVKPKQNSLNNRFMPLDEIKTEAVLMLDDDIELKQHEIIFAFKSVWRENRDRLVGFPARYHCRYDDQQLYYNSNHTCQYSLILTGAAFIHKEYLRMYDETMPELIKDKIDEWMNCEDLAMNFLIAHLTRKPPIKVTNKWTLRCPTCEDSLFKHENHYNRRHDCLRLFTKVFGYNPLLFTQFRADSVLFKTRVPAEHSKCFRYV